MRRIPASLSRRSGSHGSPRCIACGYTLAGLPAADLCPECSAPFDLNDPGTFSEVSPYAAPLYWLPALLLSFTSSTVIILVCVYLLGSWGWSLWLGAPFAGGILLGYSRTTQFCWVILGTVSLALGLIGLFITLSLAGLYCALALAPVLLSPIIAGLLVGMILRETLKRTTFPQRWYLPFLIVTAAPIAAAAIEGPGTPGPAESVSTTLVINAPADACWAALQFYEDVRLEPPLLLRLGLARPLSTSGPVSSPGDSRTCIYNKGRLTKLVTSAVPGRELTFIVTEQRIGYESDILLRSGSFRFEPLDARTTALTLTTTYQPIIAPRFAWRPAERYAIRLLHTYVIESIARDAAVRPARSSAHSAR